MQNSVLRSGELTHMNKLVQLPFIKYIQFFANYDVVMAILL